MTSTFALLIIYTTKRENSK